VGKWKRESFHIKEKRRGYNTLKRRRGGSLEEGEEGGERYMLYETISGREKGEEKRTIAGKEE